MPTLSPLPLIAAVNGCTPVEPGKSATGGAQGSAGGSGDFSSFYQAATQTGNQSDSSSGDVADSAASPDEATAGRDAPVVTASQSAVPVAEAAVSPGTSAQAQEPGEALAASSRILTEEVVVQDAASSSPQVETTVSAGTPAQAGNREAALVSAASTVSAGTPAQAGNREAALVSAASLTEETVAQPSASSLQTPPAAELAAVSGTVAQAEDDGVVLAAFSSALAEESGTVEASSVPGGASALKGKKQAVTVDETAAGVLAMALPQAGLLEPLAVDSPDSGQSRQAATVSGPVQEGLDPAAVQALVLSAVPPAATGEAVITAAGENETGVLDAAVAPLTAGQASDVDVLPSVQGGLLAAGASGDSGGAVQAMLAEGSGLKAPDVSTALQDLSGGASLPAGLQVLRTAPAEGVLPAMSGTAGETMSQTQPMAAVSSVMGESAGLPDTAGSGRLQATDAPAGQQSTPVVIMSSADGQASAQAPSGASVTAASPGVEGLWSAGQAPGGKQAAGSTLGITGSALPDMSAADDFIRNFLPAGFGQADRPDSTAQQPAQADSSAAVPVGGEVPERMQESDAAARSSTRPLPAGDPDLIGGSGLPEVTETPDDDGLTALLSADPADGLPADSGRSDSSSGVSGVLSAGSSPASAAVDSQARNRTVSVPGAALNLQQSGWTDGVADRVMWMSSQNLKTADIRLDPAGLGRMRVHIELDSDQVAQVTFVSPHAGVREAIESQSQRLRDLFAQQGMNLADVNVADQSMAQSSGQGSGGQSRDQPDGAVTAWAGNPLPETPALAITEPVSGRRGAADRAQGIAYYA